MSIALVLDFLANETLDARITASGAANGTRVNSSGLVVAATAPRYDYDPTTLDPLGVKREGARTNLFTRSQAFQHADWSAVGLTPLDNNATSPDGTTNATRLAFGSTTYASVFRTVTTTTATAHVLSVFAKAGNVDEVSLELRGATGSVYDCKFTLSGAGTATVNPSAVGSPVGGIKKFPNGWYLCWIVKTTTNTTPLAIIGRVNPVNLETAYIWQADLQAGDSLASPIPTTTTSLTRSADSLTMTGTNFSSWFNATEGAIIVDYDLTGLSGACNVISFGDGTGNNFHRILTYVGGLNGKTLAAGVVSSDLVAPAVSIGSTHRAAYAYKTDDFALVSDGGTVLTDTLGTGNPTLTSADLGGIAAVGGLVEFFGHIRRVKYDNTRRSNADLQALTVARAGAASITEDADTLAATSQVRVKGTAAITEGADTILSAGEVGIAPVVPSGRRVAL